MHNVNVVIVNCVGNTSSLQTNDNGMNISSISVIYKLTNPPKEKIPSNLHLCHTKVRNHLVIFAQWEDLHKHIKICTHTYM